MSKHASDVLDGSPVRTSLTIALIALILNLGVGLYVAVLIVWSLGSVPVGEVIRPMGLAVHLGGVMAVAAALGIPFGVLCICAAYDRWRAYPVAVFAVISGLIPWAVAASVFNVVMDLRSLTLAD